ncbi:MAG: beta/gamma crystallin-related protein [Nostoc sp. ChiSLP02]|nr:beta/gamma crystallin-related protein [Nostoc sp. DedSLP05]MDZ8102305.1 beta/gamma crystallin-related protein [Nostoc sp. DedSLP01]MDZ8189993.1 beta/gamma crystallin-related protein [Nostoc sp. ChiSLP02]
MSHINNQTQYLDSMELLQDLEYETAATITGGSLSLFDNPNGGGQSVRLTSSDPNLQSFNNRASSFRVTPNQLWYGYTGRNYKGFRILLTPRLIKNLPGIFNNSISSIRRVA